MAGMIILSTVIVTFMVRSTLNNAKRKNIHSVYIKIFLNHMQMLLITASFDLDWPPQVESLLKASGPITESSGEIVSFDCFMDTRDPDSILKYSF